MVWRRKGPRSVLLIDQNHNRTIKELIHNHQIITGYLE